VIAVTYYAFTSLSTVGFGDFHPKSDFERAICAFILLFGVAIFSYIMGTFIEILNSIQNFYDEPNEDRDLQRFFATLVQFNLNEPIPKQFKE